MARILFPSGNQRAIPRYASIRDRGSLTRNQRDFKLTGVTGSLDIRRRITTAMVISRQHETWTQYTSNG